MSDRPRLVAVLPAVLLVAVALWEVVATRCDATSVPGDDAWHAAAAEVRAGFHPGDLVVFAPDWVDPTGRLHLGDLIPVDVAARMDAAKFGRIWEVSIRGAHHRDVAGLDPVTEATHDGVTVRRFERAPVSVLADVRERMAGMTVTGGTATLELAEVGFEPHRCIQITPIPGQPTRITFLDVPLGSELVGYVGLADVFTRRDIRAPGTLAVEIGGRVVASASPGVDDGWVRFAAATTPGTAAVTFVASADAPRRQICFAAEARR